MKTIYIIDWVDSGVLRFGWEDPEEIDISTPIQNSIGFKVKENDEWIYIASSQDKDRNRYSGIVGIYKKNIISQNVQHIAD